MGANQLLISEKLFRTYSLLKSMNVHRSK